MKNNFCNANVKLVNHSIGQLSSQTFIRFTQILKYKIPFESNQDKYTEQTTEDNSSSKLTNNRINPKIISDQNSINCPILKIGQH